MGKDEDVARIAAGLTKAQRLAVARHMQQQVWAGRGDHAVWVWQTVGRELKKLRLIDFSSDESRLRTH